MTVLMENQVENITDCFRYLYNVSDDCIFTSFQTTFLCSILTNIIFQWLESEKLRLGHLRDRASDTGRRKEYPFIIPFSSDISHCFSIYLLFSVIFFYLKSCFLGVENDFSLVHSLYFILFSYGCYVIF